MKAREEVVLEGDCRREERRRRVGVVEEMVILLRMRTSMWWVVVVDRTSWGRRSALFRETLMMRALLPIHPLTCHSRSRAAMYHVVVSVVLTRNVQIQGPASSGLGMHALAHVLTPQPSSIRYYCTHASSESKHPNSSDLLATYYNTLVRL